MTAPTRGTTDKNEKSTMLKEYGLINTDFFPLFLPIPISPESCLHFFFTEAVKKGASSCVLGRYHIHAYKSAEPPGGAVAGSTTNGSTAVSFAQDKEQAAFHPAGLKLSPM